MKVRYIGLQPVFGYHGTDSKYYSFRMGEATEVPSAVGGALLGRSDFTSVEHGAAEHELTTDQKQRVELLNEQADAPRKAAADAAAIAANAATAAANAAEARRADDAAKAEQKRKDEEKRVADEEVARQKAATVPAVGGAKK